MRESHSAIRVIQLHVSSSVCSSRKLDSAELSAKYGSSIQVYNDLDSMLADPGISVVSLCGMPTQRAEQAARAARAGKNLILEKPLTLSLEELRSVQQAVKRSGVRTCVCFECRFSSQCLATKAVLDRGLLGELHYAEVDYYHGIGPWYDQFRWCASNNEGRSSLLNAGCHALDALLLCMGSQVSEVMSYDTKSRGAAFAPYEFPSTSVTSI